MRDSDLKINFGKGFRSEVELKKSLPKLLNQHVAVLGGTREGKSCVTASVLQQILRFPRPRIVVFDINGEYEQALNPHIKENSLEASTLDGLNPTLSIPYVALA